MSYENYPIDNFAQGKLNQPVIQRFGAEISEQKNLFVLRNPFNMLPSAEKMLRREIEVKGKGHDWLVNALNSRLQLWKSYAFLHINGESFTRGSFTSFLFDKWVSDKSYRDAMAEVLGYKNRDRFIDFVSDAGKGSSFSGSTLHQKSDVLSRWKDSESVASSLIMRHPEVIDYTALIFGEDSVPENFEGFRL